jgi:hypothetical protein
MLGLPPATHLQRALFPRGPASKHFSENIYPEIKRILNNIELPEDRQAVHNRTKGAKSQPNNYGVLL